MNKKAQSGLAFKFFIIGLLVGIAIGVALLYLSKAGILPFRIPLVCK